MSTRIKGSRFAAMSVLLLCATAMQGGAATITVTNTNDSGPGSLRQALTIANDGDTITFAVTGTIGLTSGGLLIVKNITISGPGSNQLSIDGNQALFVFGIFPGKTATISGLTIRNAEAGAGVWNEQGTLAVSNCVLTSNSYDGLYNHEGTLNVNNCALSGNSTGLSNDGGIVTVGSGVLSGNSYSGLYNYLGVTNVSSCVVSGNQSYGLGNYGAEGYLTIASSTVSDNSGPGVYNFSYRPLPTPGTTALNGRSRSMPAEGWSDGGYCRGCMTIADSIVSGNSGPGVSNVSNGPIAVILNSALTGNSAGPEWGGGGGISTTATFKAAPAQVTVGNSTISGNSATYGGGILSSKSALTIVNSTISGNLAADSGGGVASAGTSFLTIVNSTVSGNSAGSGGGIYNAGGAQIANSTFSGNSAPSGGGIYNSIGQSGPRLEIGDTILNAGASGENIFNNSGTITSDGYNVCSDNGGGFLNGPGDQINTDPLLGPLQDNGGPTLTHAPLPGSPAIDAGDPNFTPPPYYDQRGPCYRRVYGRRIDVGSVEVQRPRCVTPAPRPTPH